MLQERADRIKKREAQKASNRQRRMEKEQKEREARRRMGIAEPKKAYVSPRQERLSQFVRGGGKCKEEEDTEDTLGDGAEGSEGSDQSLEDLLVDQSCLLERGSPVRPLQPTSSNRQRSQNDPSLQALHSKPASTQLDDWAAFFVSNTQIQRELTDDESDEEGDGLESKPGGKGCAMPVEVGTEDLLGLIATQDLEFDIDEREEIIPIEETLPMFLSQDAETSGDEQTNLDRGIKHCGDDTAEAEDLTPFFLTQDLDFSEDELDEWMPSQAFRARSQGTISKLVELRCQLADLKDTQPSARYVGAATTAIAAKANIKRLEQPSAADEDDEEFAFSSQDLLALEKAAAVQDVTGSPSSSGTSTGYDSDDYQEDTFEKYMDRLAYGEEEFDLQTHLNWLSMYPPDEYDEYDYGGL